MAGRLPGRWVLGGRRLRRFRRRWVRGLYRRLEETRTLVHVSILLFVPALIGLLTYLSNHTDQLSFFLFPPLAAGTYTLFANPEGEYASPVRFVAGLTAGAVCAWVALLVAVWVVYPDLPPTAIEVDAPGAAFAVFLTAAVTWAFGIEESAAFSTALLGLLVDPGSQVAFVVSVFLASSIVAGVFVAWREYFYEQRAEYLYRSTKGDDHVLVPMRGATPEATAILGARLAAAHDAGKVVLLDLLEEPSGESPDSKQATTGDGESTERGGSESIPDEVVSAAAGEMEAVADRIEQRLEVPCQVVVAASGPAPASTAEQVADESGCDLIATPYETTDGEPSPFVVNLLDADVDTLVHNSHTGRTGWEDVTVPVRRAGDTAHAMIDFALRLVGEDGRVSVARCIDSEDQRRAADEMLENLVETTNGRIETRVANASIQEFLARAARTDDLVVVGASRDRSRASRLLSPPTFERLDDIGTDVAVVDRR